MNKVRYVWLNTTNGEFSNSWSEKEHEKANFSKEEMDKATKDGWKQIKYECENDKDFVFNQLMKLR